MLLVDADLYLYRCLAATEEEHQWEDDVWSLITDMKLAKELFFDQLENFKDEMRDDDVILCLSSKTNFRKNIDPGYKAQRKKTRKPLGYVALVDWAQHHFRCFSKPGLEADDCLGILATKPENAGRAIIVSDDKDMRTIPGKLYRPSSSEKLTIDEQQADYHFYTQCLTGDPTDGYAGLKGCGPKTAQKILGNRPAWSLVEQAYKNAGFSRDEALVQARLARILRWSDWDDKNNKPILYGAANGTA